MRLSEMKQLLGERGIRLTKSLGQNFLHDANQLRRITEAAELTRDDKVLEIGPGLGPLTERLVEAAGEVLAIEKDRRLFELLRERFNNSEAVTAAASARARGKVRFLHADALDYFCQESSNWTDWKLVSNLPYSVASPILVELCRGAHGPKRMVATLQAEVARRLMAIAGEADYGVLTLLVQLDYEPTRHFKIPAACFFPEPEVDSACVCLTRRPDLLLEQDERATFRELVKLSFSQRRKMMLKLLKAIWEERALAATFEKTRLPVNVRAEAVSLGQFVELAKFLHPMCKR